MPANKGKSKFKGELGITVIKKNSKVPKWKRQLLSVWEDIQNLFRETKKKTTYQEAKDNE